MIQFELEEDDQSISSSSLSDESDDESDVPCSPGGSWEGSDDVTSLAADGKEFILKEPLRKRLSTVSEETSSTVQDLVLNSKLSNFHYEESCHKF